MQPNIHQHVYGALIVAVFVSGGLAPASAQDAIPVTLGAHVSYMTRYLFAGVPFSTGGVMQGTVDLGYGSWTFHAFTNYDAHPDGQRFVMVANWGAGVSQSVVVVVNWFEELRQLVRGGS